MVPTQRSRQRQASHSVRRQPANTYLPLERRYNVRFRPPLPRLSLSPASFLSSRSHVHSSGWEPRTRKLRWGRDLCLTRCLHATHRIIIHLLLLCPPYYYRSITCAISDYPKLQLLPVLDSHNERTYILGPYPGLGADMTFILSSFDIPCIIPREKNIQR